MVEYEGAKVDTGLPIFNYAVGYNLNNCELLMYEKYPRSINDVSQLRLDETLKGIQKLTESLQIEKEKLVYCIIDKQLNIAGLPSRFVIY